MVFIDTNIFIRLLTKDDDAKAAKVYEFFQKVESGLEAGFLLGENLAEIVFVLMSKKLYNLSRKEIYDRINPIVLLPNIKMNEKEKYILALEVFVSSNLDFEDCVLLAFCGPGDQIMSYDKGLDKKTNSRFEP